MPPLADRLAARLLKLLPSRPPVRGLRRVPGLRADVQVAWTDGGIPHLSAQSGEDLFFAQGFLCASERLFQMELARRTARGELAEIFGATAPAGLARGWRGQSLVEVDLFLRRLSFVEAGRAGLESSSLAARTLIDAYAAGISAWIESGSTPLEHQLLGVPPRPWTAVDSAAVWKLNAFQLSRAWRAGLVAEAVRSRFLDNPAKARALLPNSRDDADTLLPGWDAAGALAQAQTILGGPSTPGVGGSNAWAVAGSRTASGRAVLCGDLHLPLQTPTQGWLAHLSGAEFDVAGWCVPGVPGVVVGHNQHLAWSVTGGATMDAQWALERLGQDRDSVRTATGFEPLEGQNTEVLVRGGKPVRARLRHSPNGPVIEGPLVQAPEGHVLALRWTGHLPTPDLEAALDLDRAHDEVSLGQACARLGTPALNVVWADAQGAVGWRFAGVLPRYRQRPSVGAVPGWTPQEEWDGVDACDTLPALSQPADGLVISANQKLAPEGGPAHLGDLFDPPWRARRIRERLTAMTSPTLDDAMALQLDRVSGFGRDFQQRFLRAFSERLEAPPTGDAGEVFALALSWNGSAGPGSAGAAATWAFVGQLAKGLLLPALGEPLYRTMSAQPELLFEPLLKVLERRGEPFVTPEALDALAVGALDEAAAVLKASVGDVSMWRLGKLRRLRFFHPLASRPGLGALFAQPVLHGGGDGSSVNRAMTTLDSNEVIAASVFRHGVETGDWDAYRVVLATGQSGDPTSGRYRDHLERWRQGRWFVLPFSSEAVAAATTHRATLSPDP